MGCTQLGYPAWAAAAFASTLIVTSAPAEFAAAYLQYNDPGPPPAERFTAIPTSFVASDAVSNRHGSIICGTSVGGVGAPDETVGAGWVVVVAALFDPDEHAANANAHSPANAADAAFDTMSCLHVGKLVTVSKDNGSRTGFGANDDDG